MLTRLSIRNIVLIEALDLAFGRGLGVLTGETGAGKSILLDALGLVARDGRGIRRCGRDYRPFTSLHHSDRECNVRARSALPASPADTQLDGAASSSLSDRGWSFTRLP